MEVKTYMGIPREWIPWWPTIDPERCIGCGECLSTCPNNVFAMNEAANRMEVANPKNCVVLCDKCAGFCPQEAIRFPDKKEFKQVLAQLREKAAGEAGQPGR